MLMTTQFFDEAESIADRIMVLSAGKIVYFALLIMISIAGRLKAIGGVLDIKKQLGTGHTLYIHHR